MQNPPMIGFHSPSTASPMSAGFDFTPQMGNAQIPDLKNVMFPSDNPFAYPNQGISALESVDGPYSYQDASIASSDNGIFGTPTSASTQMPPHSTSQLGYDYSFQQALNDNPNLAQQFGTHGRHYGAPITDILAQNAIGSDHVNLGGLPTLHDPMNLGDIAGGPNPDEYWERVNKGQAGMRTGLTPGVPSGMDEYFDNDSWNPVWGDAHFNNPQ